MTKEFLKIIMKCQKEVSKFPVWMQKVDLSKQHVADE